MSDSPHQLQVLLKDLLPAPAYLGYIKAPGPYQEN